MDETESKTPSFMVLVQEQLNSLILSSFLFYISMKVKEPGDFTSDTLALDERLVTLISVKNYIHMDGQRWGGSGN